MTLNAEIQIIANALHYKTLLKIGKLLFKTKIRFGLPDTYLIKIKREISFTILYLILIKLFIFLFINFRMNY